MANHDHNGRPSLTLEKIVIFHDGIAKWKLWDVDLVQVMEQIISVMEDVGYDEDKMSDKVTKIITEDLRTTPSSICVTDVPGKQGHLRNFTISFMDDDNISTHIMKAQYKRHLVHEEKGFGERTRKEEVDFDPFSRPGERRRMIFERDEEEEKGNDSGYEEETLDPFSQNNCERKEKFCWDCKCREEAWAQHRESCLRKMDELLDRISYRLDKCLQLQAYYKTRWENLCKD